MHITSSYYRCRQHQDTLELGVGSGFARIVDQAALDTGHQAKTLEPLRPSTQTLQRLASRYKSTSQDQVA